MSQPEQAEDRQDERDESVALAEVGPDSRIPMTPTSSIRIATVATRRENQVARARAKVAAQ